MRSSPQASSTHCRRNRNRADPKRRRRPELAQRDEQASLGGFACFQLAVDPADREHCVVATTNGLYERVPSGASFTWQRRHTGAHTSVAVARAGGMTTWFAASNGDRVYSSFTGATWAAIGTGFPTGIGRIASGCSPTIRTSSTPTSRPLRSTEQRAAPRRRSRDMAQHHRRPRRSSRWPGALRPPHRRRPEQRQPDVPRWRLPQRRSVSRLDLALQRDVLDGASSTTGTSIGNIAHADVHALVHVPGSSARLFAGTDGGVFEHPSPPAQAASRRGTPGWPRSARTSSASTRRNRPSSMSASRTTAR